MNIRRLMKRVFPALVSLHMKSGSVIRVEATDFSIRFDGSKLTSIHWTFVGVEKVMWVDLTQVEAITYRGKFWR